MGDRELTNWVNDQLYALLGYAEGSIASYIVALGESRLKHCLPVTRATITFNCVSTNHIRTLLNHAGFTPLYFR